MYKIVNGVTYELSAQEISDRAADESAKATKTSTRVTAWDCKCDIEWDAAAVGAKIRATGDSGNIDLYLLPKGTGNVKLGTVKIDGDQTVGAGQDGYVLKYANGTGLVSLQAGGWIANVVEDTTPELGGNLSVNGMKIVSVSNGNIDIEPHGTGNILLGNYTFDGDQSVGAGQDGYVLKYSNSSGLITLQAGGGGGINNVIEDVTPDLGGNLSVNGYKIVSVSNGNIDIEPHGTGNILLGNLTFDGDQTVGAGQDGYVLKYDNGIGQIYLQADNMGISSVSQDTSPSLGGNLNVSGRNIASPDGTDYLSIPNGTVFVYTNSTSRMDITDSGVRLGNANARVTTILDEDNMASNSDTALCTQQSIKAYADAGDRLVFISQSTASASATIDFTGLNSTYRMYYVVINNVQPATDQAQLYMRTSTNNGVSYDSGATNYSWNAYFKQATAGVATLGSVGASFIALSPTAATYDMGNAANERGAFIIRIFRPSDAQYCHVLIDGTYMDEAGAGTITRVIGAGRRNAAADVDAIRFLFSSGNIASGTFTLYGVKNA